MNLWIMKTSRGKRIINIDPTQHAVIMGELYVRATMKRIGKVTRQPSAEEIAALNGRGAR